MPAHRSSGDLIAHIDGASRGNPGPAAYAVLMETADGDRLTCFSKYLGRATNNVAEYQALLAALDYALEHHYPRLRVLTDSELMARQVEGSYKVKSTDLKPLHEQARRMIVKLEAFSIRNVPREENREADRLANEALDAAGQEDIHDRDTKTPGKAITEDPSSNSQEPKIQRELIPIELDRIATAVVDAAFAVHSGLGPGLLENVYRVCLVHELKKRGLAVEQQVVLPVYYDGVRVDAGLPLDLLVEKSLILEIKAVETLLPVHTAQVLTYLKLAGYRLGLLINFNVLRIRDGIRRVAL